MIETTVRLKPVDRDGPSIEIFKEATTGKVVIGRGEFLRCADKKVSRVHAELELESDGTLYLEALHVNPCFYYEDGKEELREEIRKGNRQKLRDADNISLLPNSYIFRVVLECVATANNNSEEKINVDTYSQKTEQMNGNGIKKEEFSSNTEESDDKQNQTKSINRKRTLPSWLLDTTSETSAETKQGTSKVAASKTKRNKHNHDGSISTRPTTSKNMDFLSDSDESLQNDVLPLKKENKSKSDILHKSTDDEKQSDSDTKETKSENVDSKAKRQSCYYGKKCYRKNSSHLEEYSHPGDSDYTSDTNEPLNTDRTDDRPECEYGLNCYRKNSQHCSKYKHTSRPRPQRRAAKEAKKKASMRRDESDASDSYDESFIDDDSDEYVPSKDDSDFSGDDCDLNSLKKDANSFINNRKFHHVYK